MFDGKALDPPAPGEGGTSSRSSAVEVFHSKMAHNIKGVTKHEQSVWRCKAYVLFFFHLLLTLGVIAGNLILVLMDLKPELLNMQPQGECEVFSDVFPIPWLVIFIGNAGIAAIALCLGFVGLIGGMLMSNIHLVKASQFAARTAQGDDQSENYYRELAWGHRSAEKGFSICRTSHCLLSLLLFIFILWCSAGWVMFTQAKAGCETQKERWPFIFGVMMLWAILDLILQRIQGPLI